VKALVFSFLEKTAQAIRNAPIANRSGIPAVNLPMSSHWCWMRKPVAAKVIALMAKGHSYLWRKPGRRDEERRRFAALMRKIEKIRLREGLTKRALAAEIGASEDGLHSWISGRSIGRPETVAKIKDFLKRKEIERARPGFRQK
jgi:ribosome-binding protein aMBF1 (putative translation factor)